MLFTLRKRLHQFAICSSCIAGKYLSGSKVDEIKNMEHKLDKLLWEEYRLKRKSFISIFEDASSVIVHKKAVLALSTNHEVER